MSSENLYQKLKKYNRPSSLIKGFFGQELDKKMKGNNVIDLGAGVRK